MAKLIEFCGAPGVGKSTIYQALSERWKENENWIPAHQIYPRKLKSQNPFKKFVNSVLEREQSLDDKAMRKAGGRFVALYPAYVDQCWAHIMGKEKKGLNGTDQRFEKASHVFKMMQRVQTCREHQATQNVIIEEGLVNAVGNALHLLDSAALADEIKALFQNMPLPDGLILVEADADTVVGRIKARKRFVPSFENVPQNDLLRAIEEVSALRKAAVEVYQNEGHPVLYVNAANPVSQNADSVLKYMKTFT